MARVTASGGGLSVVAQIGDAKTLLAFDISEGNGRKDLAGFTIDVKPPGQDAYFLYNNLQFERPQDHAQDRSEPPFSSVNAPFHKFRWLHVPGIFHQGLEPAQGSYRYAVTPRYFAGGKLQPLDPGRTVSLEVPVCPFRKNGLRLGFTRGFTQSQGFVRRFGANAKFKPAAAELLFDTSQVAGTGPDGRSYTYEQMYDWGGSTARHLLFEILNEVRDDAKLSLDLFAYDLNEPDFAGAVLDLAAANRVRILLDDAALHHNAGGTRPEDRFEAAVKAKAPAGADLIRRGHFGRYAHDKVLIVKRDGRPEKVLTGSTNFSVTGLYVNSNHVLVFEDPDVAAAYAGVFQQGWDDRLRAGPFAKSDWSKNDYAFPGASTVITFSPHQEQRARDVLSRIVDRTNEEAQRGNGKGCVLFAVMELGAKSENPVYDALNALHADDGVFTMGISDSPSGIQLYEPGKAGGLLVTGEPARVRLPPPFNQVPGVGLGHQIHHKFVVAGFSGDDPVVFCGSSNLALMGEQVNGDNLLQIRDEDVATAFAIEAVGLVDHFQFLDRMSTAPNPRSTQKSAPASKQAAAAKAGWFLGVTDLWAKKYFDPQDLHCRERVLFAR
jgi:PLD-like domain